MHISELLNLAGQTCFFVVDHNGTAVAGPVPTRAQAQALLDQLAEAVEPNPDEADEEAQWYDELNRGYARDRC
jgi:hypothetical protein